MIVYVLMIGLKDDPLSLESVWSSRALAVRRAKWLETDEYFARYGNAVIHPETVDDPKNAVSWEDVK